MASKEKIWEFPGLCKMSKQPFLIFDSGDKAGKDSLIAAFHKATGFKYSAINRWSGTNFSYGKFFNRKLDYNFYFNQDFKIKNDALLIYLEAPQEILEKRFKEHNEKDIDVKDYDRLKSHYEEYLKLTPLKFIRINTAEPIEKCVEKIKEFIAQKEIINLDEEIEIIQMSLEEMEHTIFQDLKTILSVQWRLMNR